MLRSGIRVKRKRGRVCAERGFHAQVLRMGNIDEGQCDENTQVRSSLASYGTMSDIAVFQHLKRAEIDRSVS
jgi:hypothetical protein